MLSKRLSCNEFLVDSFTYIYCRAPITALLTEAFIFHVCTWRLNQAFFRDCQKQWQATEVEPRYFLEHILQLCQQISTNFSLPINKYMHTHTRYCPKLKRIWNRHRHHSLPFPGPITIQKSNNFMLLWLTMCELWAVYQEFPIALL